jgi:hypothetical protein
LFLAISFSSYAISDKSNNNMVARIHAHTFPIEDAM